MNTEDTDQEPGAFHNLQLLLIRFVDELVCS